MAVITDSFTRADSAVSLGLTDQGQAWNPVAGTPGIASNRAYLAVAPGGGVIGKGVVTTAPDVDVSVTVAALQDGIGLLARLLDSDNYWFAAYVAAFSTYNFGVVVGGAASFIGNTGLSGTPGDVLRIVASGTSVSLYLNGVLMLSTLSSTHQTATGAGLHLASATGAGRLDNFSATFTPLTGGTGNPYTTADILGGRVRSRKDSYLFDLLDINGAFLSSVSPARDSPATIENDTTRTNPRTLSGFTVDARHQAAINTLVARIRPRMVLQNGVSYNLGVFLFGDASRPRRSWGLELGATLVDQTFVLSQEVGRVVSIPEGTNCVAAALALAQEVIGGSANVTASGVVTGSPKAYQPNQTRQFIIDDLLAIAAFLPVHFDNNGAMTMRPAPTIPTVAPADFAYEQGITSSTSPIIKDSMLESDDLLTAPNRWVVIDTSATTSPIVGSYDLPASAPNSISERGFAVTKTTELQGIGSADAAARAAYAQSIADGHGFKLAEFDGLHDPRHDTYNIVQYLSNQHLELGWSIELRSGAPMHHRLRRAYS